MKGTAKYFYNVGMLIFRVVISLLLFLCCISCLYAIFNDLNAWNVLYFVIITNVFFIFIFMEF